MTNDVEKRHIQEIQVIKQLVIDQSKACCLVKKYNFKLH